MSTSRLEVELDHLVVAATTLREGQEYIEAKLGSKLSTGGKHTTMGTHNALLSLGGKVYLEVIAIDPNAPKPSRKRWFSLDDEEMQRFILEKPRLIHWVVRCSNISLYRDLYMPSATVAKMSRSNYNWNIVLSDDGSMPFEGLFPTPIEWIADPLGIVLHPCDSLTKSGCLLKCVKVASDNSDFQSMIEQLTFIHGPFIKISKKFSPPSLSVVVSTPDRGDVTLD